MKKDRYPGLADHRIFVGAPRKYDLLGHLQFNLLTLLGLREEDYVLDIGCGALRAGRLFIVYLLPGRYFAIEPEQWLVQEALEKELGRDCVELKQPRFSDDRNFTCTLFGQKFDFIVAYSIFTHAAPVQVRRCLQEAQKCMNPGSLFVATIVEGEENYAGSEWAYPECITYRFDWLAEAAKEAGLICRRLQWFHPRDQTWVLFARPENEAQVEELSQAIEFLPRKDLRKDLRYYKDRLAKLEAHPYVRLGLRVHRWLQKIRGRTS